MPDRDKLSCSTSIGWNMRNRLLADGSRYRLNDIVAARGTRTIFRIIHVYDCGMCYQLLEHAVFPQGGMIAREDDIIGVLDPPPTKR